MLGWPTLQTARWSFTHWGAAQGKFTTLRRTTVAITALNYVAHSATRDTFASPVATTIFTTVTTPVCAISNLSTSLALASTVSTNTCIAYDPVVGFFVAPLIVCAGSERCLALTLCWKVQS